MKAREALIFINDIKPYMIIPYKINQIKTCLYKQETGIQRRFKCKFCENHYASPPGRRRHELSVHNQEVNKTNS